MAIRHDLLNQIAIYIGKAGMTEREFGYAAVGDGRLVDRIRVGKGTFRVIEKTEAFLDGRAVDARERRRRAGGLDDQEAAA